MKHSNKVESFFDQISVIHPEAAKTLRGYYTYGSLRPVFDDKNQDGYFACNCGAGVAYASMKFVKIGLAGQVLASFRTNNAVRCLYIINKDRVLIALDKKYLLLNIADLSLVEKFEKSVPHYSDQVILHNDMIYSVNTIINKLRVYDTRSYRSKEFAMPGTPETEYKKMMKADKLIQPSMELNGDNLSITTQVPAKVLTFDTVAATFV